MIRAVEDWLPRHRITVHEYYRMGELGLLAPDARVELIEGVIIDVAPIGSRHSSVVAHLTKLLVRAVGDAANGARTASHSPERLLGTTAGPGSRASTR